MSNLVDMMSVGGEHKFSWQQTMLRIKNPKVSIPYYETMFGFTLIHYYNFPQWNFSLYFLEIMPEGSSYNLEPGTKESEDYLWSMTGTCLELTHNHGSETDDTFMVNNGNIEPNRGFGHLAVMTNDVYAACEQLETAGVKFQKKPDDGRMKGLAFALDPDGYWIEIIRNANGENLDASISPVKYTFAQTMMRVKDPVKSLAFYRDLLGMDLLAEQHMGEGD